MYTGMNLVHMAQASDKFQEQMESMARRMVSPREKERERERERETHTERERGGTVYVQVLWFRTGCPLVSTATKATVVWEQTITHG